MPLTVVDHPLVTHRVGLLRDRATPPARFRAVVGELSTLLAYEAARDLVTTTDEVTTPLDTTASWQRLVGPGPLVVPILRAGLGLLDGVLAALPEAEVGIVGLRRDEHTLQPRQYAAQLPDDLTGRDVFVLDPMLATGGSLAAVLDLLAPRHPARITAVCLIAAPEGVSRAEAAWPGVHVFTAALDPGLNDVGFIVPGLGDAGDRLFGAAWPVT